MPKNNHEALIARNNSVDAGIDRYVTTNVTIGGVTYTPAQLKAVFQAHTTALQTSDGAHEAWQSEVLAATAAGKTPAAVYGSLRSYLVGLYGKTAVTTLAASGMTAPKTTTPTVAVKAAAAVKRSATRTARHTMGSNEKKKVTGNVAAIVVTPVTTTTTVSPTPVASAPTTTPAASPTTPTAPAGGAARATS
jgi:hypothetical protein